MALISVGAAALGLTTYRRNEDYQSRLAIWNHTVLNCPLNHRAYNNLGNAYLAIGQVDAAIKYYDKAIALNPNLAAAYQNRAIARTETKDYVNAWADVRMLRKLGGTPSPRFVADLATASGRSE